MHTPEIALFAPGTDRELGQSVAERLGVPLSRHEEREFEDGEHKARPLENIRGCDVFVVHSLYGDTRQSVNDKLVRLLFFLGALRDASAERVTAVTPYLCYARKDRKTKSRDPVTTRYVAGLFEAVGTDRVVAMDVHNLAAFQNAFRCRTDHLEARPLFADYFAERLSGEAVAVVSPDVGGIKRAEAFRQTLARRLGRDVNSAFLEKQRSEGVVTGEAVVGELRDKVAILLDDLIASGTTIARAARACRARGAARVYAAATHGVFTDAANESLADPSLQEIVITNTVSPFRLTTPEAHEKLVTIDAAGLFAEAIRRIHSGGSVTALMAD